MYACEAACCCNFLGDDDTDEDDDDSDDDEDDDDDSDDSPAAGKGLQSFDELIGGFVSGKNGAVQSWSKEGALGNIKLLFGHVETRFTDCL